MYSNPVITWCWDKISSRNDKSKIPKRCNRLLWSQKCSLCRQRINPDQKVFKVAQQSKEKDVIKQKRRRRFNNSRRRQDQSTIWFTLSKKVSMPHLISLMNILLLQFQESYSVPSNSRQTQEGALLHVQKRRGCLRGPWLWRYWLYHRVTFPGLISYLEQNEVI